MKFCSNVPENKWDQGPLAKTATSSPPCVSFGRGTIAGNLNEMPSAENENENGKMSSAIRCNST